MGGRRILPSRAPGEAGQALVEFAFALIPFLVLLMGLVDVGRGIYMLNGTSEAAREIARVTAVHPYDSCCDLGSGSQAQAVIATQRGLIPALLINPSTDISCVDINDATIPDNECRPGDFVKVHLTASYQPITPLVSSFLRPTFESYARVQVP